MTDKALTPKQERFAQVYVETGNASEAYRQAYTAENMTADTLKVEACRTLALPNVSLTVDLLQAEHAKRHAVTVDSITKELDEARIMAAGKEKPEAMINASNSKAKLHGLVVDRSENKTEHSVDDSVLALMGKIDGTSRKLPNS